MCKQKWFFWSLILCFYLMLATVASAAESPLVRVRLAEGINQCGFKVTNGSYKLVDTASGQELPVDKGEQWQITVSAAFIQVSKSGNTLFTTKGPVVLKADETKSLSTFAFQTSGNVEYRENLNIYLREQKLMAINVLDLESYLYGVIGREMGGGSPLEAYKAQALVARSYALYSLGENLDYDMTTGTDTQVYGGYTAEKAYSTGGYNAPVEAVKATNGEVICYDGKVIQAFFHSNAGGYTENSENIWFDARPYLRAVASPADSYALTVGGWAADTYEWTKDFTRAELEQKFQVGTIDEINTKSWETIFTEGTDGKPVRQLIPGTEIPSGRLTVVEVVGTDGTKTFYRDGIRLSQAFGLRSTLCRFDFDSTVCFLDENGKPVTVDNGTKLVSVGIAQQPVPVNSELEHYSVLGARDDSRVIPKVFSKLKISGKGNGHGLGLSQWGARGMAAQGYNYQDIIEHYYNQGKYDGKLAIKKGYAQ